MRYLRWEWQGRCFAGTTLAGVALFAARNCAGTELRLANCVTLLAKFGTSSLRTPSTYAGTGTFPYRW
jgi:hypothetical protein